LKGVAPRTKASVIAVSTTPGISSTEILWRTTLTKVNGLLVYTKSVSAFQEVKAIAKCTTRVQKMAKARATLNLCGLKVGQNPAPKATLIFTSIFLTLTLDPMVIRSESKSTLMSCQRYWVGR
jgi:hypothetical protein